MILPSLKLYGSRCKDIDLAIFASFDPPIRRRFSCRTSGNLGDATVSHRDVEIFNSCVIIEVKSHDDSGFRWIGSQAEVKYDGECHNEFREPDEAFARVIRCILLTFCPVRSSTKCA